nr:auxilin-like protein 1 isoform X1 [Quercus suber]
MEYQASSATISKKLSSGHSFSSKSIYDGVFSAPSSKFGAPNISSRIQDYSEIFGEASRACSIPILDIPTLNERNVSADDADAARSSKLDYSNVFGGFEEFDYAVSYEELISEPKKKKKNSSSQKARRTPAERGLPSKVEDHLDCREKNQMNSHEASYQSFDSVKKYNMSYNKVNQGGKNGTNVTTHIAQLHAVPGYTHLIEESTPLQMADRNKPVTSAVNDVYLNKKASDGITEGMHSRKVVTDLPASGAGKQKSRVGVALQNKSDRRRSNSIDMHEYHHGAHSVKVSRFSGPLPNLHDMRLIDESTPLQKTDSNKPATSAVNDVNLNKNFSDKITEDIHSTKVVTDLPASGASKQKARGGVALQNDSDRHRSNSIDMLFGANEYGHGAHSLKKVSKFSGPLPNSCVTRLIDESSPLQMNDSNKAVTSAENDVYLNKNFSDRITEGIHSTKVVTDLPASGASKQKSRGGAALQNKSDRRRSNSIDMLFGVNEYVHGAHSLKVSPFSGPLPNSCDPRLIDERSPLQMNDSNKPVTSAVNDVILKKNFSDRITEGIHSTKVVTDLPASGDSKQRSRGGAALQNDSNRSRSNSCDSKGASKRPMASKSGFSRTDFENAGHISSPPCFDEEVDVNSVAAASVAALKKAIEEAQARMKIAKESMARKKEGFPSHVKLSSNDGLKAEQRREGKIADKANRSKKKDLYEKEDAPVQDSAGMRKQNMERAGHVTPDFRVREKAFGTEAAVGETYERELKPTQADHMQEAAEVWDAEEQFYEFETVVKHKETMLEFEQADKTKKECFKKPEECSQRANTFEEACKQEKIEQKVIAVEGAFKSEENVGELKSDQQVFDLEENEKRLRVVQEQNKSEKKVEVSHEQEKWEETLTYFHEPMNYVETIETQELEKNENVKRQIEGQEWVQNVKKVEASHEQEMFEETLTDFQEPMNYVENIETQEFEENENMKRQTEAQEWVENVKKVKACHEQETFEEKPGDLQEPINFVKNIETQKYEENEIMKWQIEAQELLENEKKGKLVCEEEDIEKENIKTQEFEDNENMKRQIESQEYIESEKNAKEAFEEEDIEKEPEDAHKREDTEEACKLEIGKEQKDALREEETEKCIDKIHEQSITKIRFNDFPNEEETRNSLQDTDELKGNEKLQEAAENEELFKGDTDQIEEKVERQNEIYKWIEEKRLKVAQETLNYEEISLAATDNKCKQDGSENLSKSQEASRHRENDGDVELILEAPAQEENGSTIEENKAFVKQENGRQTEAVKDEKVVKEAEQALHQEKSLEATDGGCEQDESENKSKDQEVSRHIENEQAVKDERVVKEAEQALHYEKNVEATVDGCKQDERENLSKNQEASRHIENNKDVELNPEVPVHEENRSTVEVNTASFEHKGNGKETEVVKEENDIEDKEILETDGFPQDAFIHSEMKQQMEDKTIDFYLNGVDFVKTDMSFGKKQLDQNAEEQKIVCNLGRNIEEMDPELGEIYENVKEVEFSADQEEVNISTSSHEDRWDDDENKLNQTEQPSLIEGEGKSKETTEEIKITQITNKREQNHQSTLTMEEKESNDTLQKEVELEKEHLKKIDEAKEREKEREREKMAVERAIREARERAFAEARERAEKAAAERAAAETRRRVMAEAREKLGKTSAEVNEKSAAEKAAMEAKLKAERAAVERATLEARERALEKALSEKAAYKARNQAEKFVGEKLSGASRDNGMRQSFSANKFLQDLQQKNSCPTSNSRYPNSSSHGGGSYSSYSTERFDGSNGDSNGESVQRCRARSERHQRIVERAAKALAEKNMRDLLAQKEQAERNRLAEALDSDVKRWSNGKEGNLRALLSTLQYILGPDSSWQPIPLTDIITTSAVKKAYRKATLFVHPDKLQQRGASIQQKYTCEKVFDLLKEAWNRFNVEER